MQASRQLCVFAFSRRCCREGGKGGTGGQREKGRRDLASSSGRVAAFNEVQMSLCWQRRAACAGGEREGGGMEEKSQHFKGKLAWQD